MNQAKTEGSQANQPKVEGVPKTPRGRLLQLIGEELMIPLKERLEGPPQGKQVPQQPPPRLGI